MQSITRSKLDREPLYPFGRRAIGGLVAAVAAACTLSMSAAAGV